MVPSQYLVTIEPHGRSPHVELSDPGTWLSMSAVCAAHAHHGSWGLLNGHFAQCGLRTGISSSTGLCVSHPWITHSAWIFLGTGRLCGFFLHSLGGEV